ncbi:unnamed protein product, partial [marine sediment metagenome]
LQFKETFNIFDKNGDGKICRSELASVIRCLGKNPTESQLNQIMSEADTDENGFIDFTEFVRMIQNKLNYTDTEKQFIESFKLFDMDGNGYISTKELKHIMTSFGDKLTEEEANEMLRNADIDGDGLINYEEYVKMMMIN